MTLATARLKAEGVIRAHAQMGYTAVALAPRDLAGGLDFLRKQGKKGLPWISLNLVTDQGRSPFPPMILTKSGDLRIAILGLTGPIRMTNVRQNGYRIIPWQQALPPALAEADRAADMVILLSSYPFRINQQIAQNLEGIAIILQAGNSEANMTPRLVGNTLICQAASRGKYLGILDIDWSGGERWVMKNSARRALLQERLSRIGLQMERIRKGTPDRAMKKNSSYRHLLATQADIEKELRALASEDGQQQGSTYSNRFIALETSLPEDRQVAAIVRQTLRRANDLSRKELEKRRKERKEAGKTRRRLTMLAGAGTCSGCHQRQAAFWRRTRHASAWQTLVIRNRQFDRTCQSCHATLPAEALAQAGMQTMPPAIPVELRGVGCESCHGPGRRHADNPAGNRLRLPDESTCTTCHQAEHDAAFSYADRLARVRCPKTTRPGK